MDRMEADRGEDWLPAIVPAVKLAFAADPENAHGLRSRAFDLLLAAGVADAEVGAAVRRVDPGNEEGLYERYVEVALSRVGAKDELPGALAMLEALFAAGEIRDPGRAIDLRKAAVVLSARHLDLPEKARIHARALRALRPDDPDIESFLERVLGK
jgi:hypothetical protein